MYQRGQMSQRCGSSNSFAHLIVAIAVAHGMSILALDDRPVFGRDVGERDALIYPGIHGTYDVCSVRA